jgi:anti-sigma factor RsiW
MSLLSRRRRRNDLTCRRAVELITDYLDGALPADLRLRLEAHLATCPHCREYLEQIRATIKAAGRIGPDELSPRARRTLIQLYRSTQRP